MDWSKPMIDMVQMWTDTHQKIWSGWVETMQGIGRAPTPDLRGKIIETWQQSLKSNLEIQSESIQQWLEGLRHMEGVPDHVSNGLAQAQVGMKQWYALQQELWEHLFDVLRAAEPGATAHSLEKASADVFKTWQDTVRQTMENQVEWMKRSLQQP
jgi:hypothetical protein